MIVVDVEAAECGRLFSGLQFAAVSEGTRLILHSIGDTMTTPPPLDAARASADDSGNLYLQTGNGTFDTTLVSATARLSTDNVGPNPLQVPESGDYGDSFLKLTPRASGPRQIVRIAPMNTATIRPPIACL